MAERTKRTKQKKTKQQALARKKKGQRMKVTLHKTNIPTNLVRNRHSYIGKMQQWQRQTGNEEEREIESKTGQTVERQAD